MENDILGPPREEETMRKNNGTYLKLNINKLATFVPQTVPIKRSRFLFHLMSAIQMNIYTLSPITDEELQKVL